MALAQRVVGQEAGQEALAQVGELADRIGGSVGTVAAVVIGALLILFGRKLYWLAAGVVGFGAVFMLTRRLVPELSPEALLITAVVAGIVGAALAIFAHKVLLGLVGGAGGALIGLWQAQAWGVEQGVGWLVAAVVGGLLGAWLVAKLFEFALVLLSSLLGAQLVVDGLTPPSKWVLPVFVVLVAVGLLAQLRGRRRRKRSDSS